ncbi:CDP-alcohol phosphatidyltransferase family protein [Streptacidiphilus sp. PB12-B1b]|nr:CDP-alcohol phosphatidyltransferase family protein [Streptacidiphilus sp. PB12-B1b]
MRGAQKSSKGVSYYSRWINRPLGRVLAAAAYPTGLTPNAVTGISALVTGCGIALIALVPPSWPLTVGVAALLVLGFALDSADGQLARLRRAGSPVGEWLDHTVDVAKMLTLHLALLVAFYRFYHLGQPGPQHRSAAALAMPLAYQVTAVVTFFGGILTEQLKRAHARAPGAAGRAAEAPSALRSLLLLPADYGLFCLLFLSYGGGRRVFLTVYALLLLANAVLMPALLVKWFRELSALGRLSAIPGSPAGEISEAPRTPSALS